MDEIARWYVEEIEGERERRHVLLLDVSTSSLVRLRPLANIYTQDGIVNVAREDPTPVATTQKTRSTEPATIVIALFPHQLNSKLKIISTIIF